MHVLTFAPQTLAWARTQGFSPIARSGAGSSPVVAALDAVGAIARCATAYLDLHAARAHRDGLKRILPLEEQRLAQQREQLKHLVALAAREIDIEAKVIQRLGEMVTVSAHVCRDLFSGLAELRDVDLPDLHAIDELQAEIDHAQHNLGRALKNLNTIHQETSNG